MSFVPRIYSDPAHGDKLYESDLYELSPQMAHYLGTVLRLKTQSPVVIFNNQDGEWLGEIEQVTKNRGRVLLKKQLRKPVVSVGPTLLFAPLKRDATDLAIRMATELGVKVIQPVQTSRTNTFRIKEERLLTIATEAAEQSNRLTVPEIRPIQHLFDICDQWNSDRPLLVALERCQEKAVHPSDERNYTGNEGILIGPEGGFDDAEVKRLLHYDFVRPISLGNLILKAETAIVSGLALLFPYIQA